MTGRARGELPAWSRFSMVLPSSSSSGSEQGLLQLPQPLCCCSAEELGWQLCPSAPEQLQGEDLIGAAGTEGLSEL